MSLLDKVSKASIIKERAILKNSKYFDNQDYIPTRIPLFNLALSGKLHGGLPSGIVQLAAPPKHFKTKFLHEMMWGFQEKYKNDDYVIVLYDSEIGSTLKYYEDAGLDTTRIDHRPIMSVEQLKADIANLISQLKEGDHVLICIDSIGMLRSDKEYQDAVDNKQVADMTRAKELNSLFRIITAESAIKRIPIIVINHSYGTLDKFSKEVASGGRKTQYAAHTLLFITKSQDKPDDELLGFWFTLRAGLSRYVKENSLFPILVHFDEGLDIYSGLFDLAKTFGYVEQASQGWYWADAEKTKKVRESQLATEEFFKGLLENQEFCDKVEAKYSL
jgi:hypothetical protein